MVGGGPVTDTGNFGGRLVVCVQECACVSVRIRVYVSTSVYMWMDMPQCPGWWWWRSIRTRSILNTIDTSK